MYLRASTHNYINRQFSKILDLKENNPVDIEIKGVYDMQGKKNYILEQCFIPEINEEYDQNVQRK